MLDKPCSVDPETGLTSCCKAYSTIGIDDNVEYCKKCYEPVIPSDTSMVFRWANQVDPNAR